jgi:hypothetical protein
VHLGSEEAGDLTECYLCKKQLDGWEPSDDPAYDAIRRLFLLLRDRSLLIPESPPPLILYLVFFVC